MALTFFACVDIASAEPAAAPPAVLDDTFCAQLFDLQEPVFGSKEPVYQFFHMEQEGVTHPIKLPRTHLEDGWDFNEGYTVPSHGFRVDIDAFEAISALCGFFEGRPYRVPRSSEARGSGLRFN